jgi:hypothetical protein
MLDLKGLPTKSEHMDAELSALEVQRVKTRAPKQGMMHGLLTGRTRPV